MTRQKARLLAPQAAATRSSLEDCWAILHDERTQGHVLDKKDSKKKEAATWRALSF